MSAADSAGPQNFHRIQLRGPWEVGAGRSDGPWTGGRVPFEKLWEDASFARAAAFPAAFALAAGVPGGGPRVRRAFHAPLRRREGERVWFLAADVVPELALQINGVVPPRADLSTIPLEFFASGEVRSSRQAVWEIGSLLKPHNQVELAAPPLPTPWFAAAWLVFQG